MAQSPTSHASGLERDYRQDEFPTRQDEFPTVYNHSAQTIHHGDPRVISEINSDLTLYKSATKTRSRICGLRKSTFWLVVIVVGLLVFTGIGAGVLGSRIASSGNKRRVLCS